MPEGNTVWLTARSLRQALAGGTLTRTDLRVPAYATTDLTGHRVLDVQPRGKHILMRLDDGLTLHTHLRMDGAWRVYPSGRRVGDSRDDVRVILETEKTVAVGHRVHDIALVRTADEDSLVGHLGPDLLGPDWDAAEAVRRIAADPMRAVGEAVLDQRNLAGAGNVYKTESCFLRGVSPWTPVGDITDLEGFVGLLHRLLAANRDRHNHVTTGDPRPGYRTWVYDRVGRPCRRCGTTIRSAWQGGEQGDPAYQRISYWCPRCQPGPAPPAARPAQEAKWPSRSRVR
jgi:endonuclease-8